MADGKIVFCTKIDNSQVDKDLKRLEKKIHQSEESIAKNKNAKLPLVNQANELGAKLDAAKASAEMLREEMAAINNAMAPGSAPDDYAAASANLPRVQAALKAQEKEVATLQKQWDSVNNKIDAYDLKIKAARESIAANTAKAAELSAQMNSSGAKMSAVFTKARASAEKFRKQILRVGASMIMFRVFSAVMQGISNYMGKILKTNEDYTAQLAQLKAALMTAFQPIYEFILPGLLAVLRVLTSIVMAVAQFFSALGGKTLAQSTKNAKALNEEADALKNVGNAAKDARKSLAGFDEINVLGSADTGGGGSSGIDAIKPNFDELETYTDSLGKITELVAAIGAGLLTWKIAESFQQGLKTSAGLATAVGGAFLYAFNWANAFANRISWRSLSGLLSGMVLIIGGLALAFGKTGAAVGALVTGVGLIALALYEFITTGELTTQAMAALSAGIIAVGAAISLLAKSWIPLVIAGVIAAAVAIIKYWDDIKAVAISAWEKIREVWSRFATWFDSYVIQPVSRFFSNLWTSVATFASNAWNKIKEIWNTVATWFDTKIIQPLSKFFSSMWAGVTTFASNAWNKIKEFFTPAVQWFSTLFGNIKKTASDIFYNIGVIAKGCWDVIQAAWKIASTWFNEKVIQPLAQFFANLWNGVKNTASSVWAGIKNVWVGASTWFRTNITDPVAKLFSNLWDGLKSKASAAWEGVKSVFSTVGSFFKNTFSDAWNGIINIFSSNSSTFTNIKDAIVAAFRSIVNSLIRGINSVISGPFNSINEALRKLRTLNILGKRPFSGLQAITVPQIPYLAQGAVLPANKPFLAMVGDQRHGTNIEAPLSTIQEAVAAVMGDMMAGNMAGHEATVSALQAILEAIYQIDTSDERYANAVDSYQRKMAIARGG